MRTSMHHTRIASLLLAATALGAPALAFAEEADNDAAAEASADAERAKEIQAPTNLDLDERIRPVSGQTFVKDGRHELSLTGGLSLNDGFFTKYVPGVRYAYHFTEKWSAGLTFGYAFSEASGAVTRCDSDGQDCRLPTKDELAETPGDIGMMLGADVSWAPLYGKISVLAQSVLHFDTYLVAGAGVLETKMAPPGSNVAETKMTPEVHLGVGQRYVISKNAALRFELRDLVYQMDVQGKTAKVETDIQNQLLFTIGFSYFLGSTPEN